MCDNLVLGRPIPSDRGAQQLRDGPERVANVCSNILDSSGRDGLRQTLRLADVWLQLFVNSAEASCQIRCQRSKLSSGEIRSERNYKIEKKPRQRSKLFNEEGRLEETCPLNGR